MAITMEPEAGDRKSDPSMFGWLHQSHDIHLSDREHQVLMGIADGLTNRELAEQLGIGIKTVESYRARLVAKLGLRTRNELASYAKKLRPNQDQ